MANTTKVENYSEELTQKVLSAYAEGQSLEAIAEMAQKSTRSIIAKLSRSGVYKKAERTRKDGSPVEKKNDTATAIGQILQLSANDTDSLTKATRVALQAIFSALANSKPIAD